MSAAEPGAEIRDIPAEYAPAVNAAIDVGTQLFVHDVSAARASDELVRRKIYEKDKRIRGWITDVDSGRPAVIVTFVGDVEGSPRALHRVTVPMEGAIEYEALKPAQPLEESAAELGGSGGCGTAPPVPADSLRAGGRPVCRGGGAGR